MDHPLISRTPYPNGDHEHVTGFTNAKRYSVIIKSFLSGVGSDVLRATLIQAADRADCTVREFLYLHQTSIIYNLQQRLRHQVTLVYPPDDSDPVIQQWSCRLLCLVLKATGCLDTRSEDDVNFMDRTYHKHTQGEKTKTRHSASGTKQQPKPRREWIRTCGAIQRLVENLDDARLLSSVRNFICKIEMEAKTLDARIQSHLSLTKMISELAASHSDRMSAEERVIRKQIGELAKIKQQYDTVSKPSFVSSRSARSLSRSMIVDGEETRPLSARDKQSRDKPLRPKSAGSITSQKTTGAPITKPFTRSGSFDSARVKNTGKSQKKPFSNTRNPIETVHLVTPKVSQARKQSPNNSERKNIVYRGKTDGTREAGPPNTNGKENLVSSHNKKGNGSPEVKRKFDKTILSNTRQTVSMSDFSKLSNISKNKEYTNLSRPHSFDVSGANRTSVRHNADGDCNKKAGSNLPDEKKTSIVKARNSDIEKVYTQSLKLMPQTYDKKTNSEIRTTSSLVTSHVKDSLMDKQNQARLVVSQPTYSSLEAYTSKYRHKPIRKKESITIKPENSNDTPGKTFDEQTTDDSVNHEHINTKQDIDEEEKVPQNSSLQSEPKKEPTITPTKTKNAFGLLKDMLRNAFSSKKSENTQATHISNKESSSTEIIQIQSEPVHYDTASSPALEATEQANEKHDQDVDDSTLPKLPSPSKEDRSIIKTVEKRKSHVNQNERNKTSSNMVQQIRNNKWKTSDSAHVVQDISTDESNTSNCQDIVQDTGTNESKTSNRPDMFNDIGNIKSKTTNSAGTVHEINTKKSNKTLNSADKLKDIGPNRPKTSQENTDLSMNKTHTEQSSESLQKEAKQNSREKTPEGGDIKHVKDVHLPVISTTTEESAVTETVCKIQEQNKKPSAELFQSVSNTQTILSETGKRKEGITKEAVGEEQTNGTKLRKSTRVHFGIEQDSSADTFTSKNNFREEKRRRQSLPALAFLREDKPATDIALNNVSNVKSSTSKSAAALKAKRRASLAAASLHGFTGVKPLKELNKTSTIDLNGKYKELQSAVAQTKETEDMVVVEVEKDEKLKEHSNQNTTNTQCIEGDTNLENDNRVESNRSSVKVPSAIQKQEKKQGEVRPDRRKSISVSNLTQHKSKQVLFQRSKSEAEFNSKALPTATYANEKRKSKFEEALAHNSNMRHPAEGQNKSNKKSLLDNTALCEDEADSENDREPDNNGAKQNTLREKRETTEASLNHSNIQDEPEEKKIKTNLVGANVDRKPSEQSQDTNIPNHELPGKSNSKSKYQ